MQLSAGNVSVSHASAHMFDFGFVIKIGDWKSGLGTCCMEIVSAGLSKESRGKFPSPPSPVEILASRSQSAALIKADIDWAAFQALFSPP
jgi:hypothetical protein